MKPLYWHPTRQQRAGLGWMTLVAILGLLLVEYLPVTHQERHYAEKWEAAQRAEQAFAALRQERTKRGIAIEPRFDPAGTGLIGLPMSSVTSVPGSLPAKQTSVNPNFAAVVVDCLLEAGVQRGDWVAIGCSGSFPALNVCTLAAVESLGMRPLVISSLSASQWGANDPHFLWLEMEDALVDAGALKTRSLAASLGGIEDRGLGMSVEGRTLLLKCIAEHGLPLLNSSDEIEPLAERMQWYERHAQGQPIGAYINIGGNTLSVGTEIGKHLYRPGLNLTPPAGCDCIDAVITRFSQRGIPVIHLVEIPELAARYELPFAPPTVPAIGTGGVFQRPRYNRWLAAAVLLGLLVGLYRFARSPWMVRALDGNSAAAAKSAHRHNCTFSDDSAPVSGTPHLLTALSTPEPSRE